MNSYVITQHDNNTRIGQVNNTTSTQEIGKNEDKANTKNQKIRRKPEVCLQTSKRAARQLNSVTRLERKTPHAQKQIQGVRLPVEVMRRRWFKQLAKAFVVDQPKVIDNPSAQFNNSMLQAVKGEINGIDDSYPNSGMAMNNTTHFFNEAIQQG
ncbi:hypothetical protein AgCh_029108 [Apium graveolens]